MRTLLLFLCLLSSFYAYELIYISDDSNIQSLKSLEKNYRQTLLINEKKVYLIPSDCRLERYFGGTSQGLVKLGKRPEQTQEIVLTQEVFEAKDETVIKEKIEIEKSIALVEGKVSKAFLDDKEGRGFGGASEIPLDFTFQKIAAKQSNMKVSKRLEPMIKDARKHQHPSCQLLENGSGYTLEHLNKAQFYSQEIFSPIIKNSVLFK